MNSLCNSLQTKDFFVCVFSRPLSIFHIMMSRRLCRSLSQVANGSRFYPEPAEDAFGTAILQIAAFQLCLLETFSAICGQTMTPTDLSSLPARYTARTPNAPIVPCCPICSERQRKKHNFTHLTFYVSLRCIKQ